jgi:hypothetical protein
VANPETLVLSDRVGYWAAHQCREHFGNLIRLLSNHLRNLHVGDPSLLQNTIGGMAGFDVVICWEFLVVDRAMPNLMIALSGSVIPTLLVAQYIFYPICISRHLRRFRQADSFLTLLCFTAKTKRNVERLLGVGRNLIQLKQFGNEDCQLFD